MRKRLLNIHRNVLIFIILLLLVPQSVFAYSYGDPNKEDIAEAYIFIKAKLDQNPSDWNAANQQYLVYKKVLDLEFGNQVTGTLEANFSAKDQAKLEANYRGMLVMNLKRRFDSIKKEIANYAQAKLLLAKAKGTFTVLSPYVKDQRTVTAVEEAFGLALEALGNPGLFGVGKKDTDKEGFIKQVDFIYNTVKPLFPFTYSNANSTVKTTPAQKENTTTSETKKQEPATRKADQEDPNTSGGAGDEGSKPSTKETANPEENPSGDSNDSKAGEQANSEGQSADADEPGKQENEEPSSADNTEQAAAETSGDSSAGRSETAGDSESSSEAADNDDQGKSNNSSVQEEESAAMDESMEPNMEAESRINPMISILVIGSVIMVAGAGIYFAGKKGLLKL